MTSNQAPRAYQASSSQSISTKDTQAPVKENAAELERTFASFLAAKKEESILQRKNDEATQARPRPSMTSNSLNSTRLALLARRKRLSRNSADNSSKAPVGTDSSASANPRLVSELYTEDSMDVEEPIWPPTTSPVSQDEEQVFLSPPPRPATSNSLDLPARLSGDSSRAAPTHTYSHVHVSPSDESSKPINASTTGLNTSDVKPEEPNDTAATTQAYIIAFFVDTLPRQFYLYLLLRLPYLYFSRVTRIFEEAELSMPMIRQGILDAAKLKVGGYETGQSMGMGRWRGRGMGMGMGRGWGHPRHPWWLNLEPSENMAYTRLQHTWQTFIDSLLKEWKTLNIISVLLLTSVFLTICWFERLADDVRLPFSGPSSQSFK